MEFTDEDKFFKTAKFLGLECSHSTEGEKVCLCVKCSKEDHLYWNVMKRVGYCQSCAESFTPMQLLEKLVDDLPELTVDESHALACDRGLPKEAFEDYNLGSVDGWYILPVYGVDGKLASVRRYMPGGTLQICGGCSAALFGAERLGDKERRDEPVYVCEGEWDAVSLEWLRRKAKKPGIVVAVPGAGTFKSLWADTLAGRVVLLAYDNDKAGQQGMKGACRMLRECASEIRTLRWPKGTPKGYDLRDLITDAVGRK